MRAYPQYIVAEVSYDTESTLSEDKLRGEAFKKLARYIGVFGTPENSKQSGAGEAMAMTAPVVMSGTADKQQGEAIAMTAPVVMQGESAQRSMSFILPTKYTSLRDVPVPLSKEVAIRKVDERVVLATIFSGWVTPDTEQKKRNELIASVEADGVFGSSEELSKLEWESAQYQPPFTVPMFRRNEVWLVLPLSRKQAEEKVRQLE